MVTLTNHANWPGWIDIARGSCNFGDFCKIFLPNIGEDQKKGLASVSWASGTASYGKSAPGYCFKFIKKLDEGLRKQLLRQKF